MRFAPALAALVVLAALAGCSPVSTEPEPPPPGRGWAQHILIRSEGDALAAAAAHYEAFVEVGNAISADGGKHPERIEPYATPAFFEYQLESFERLAEKNQRTSGASRVVEMRIQQWSRQEVVAYVCQDFSEVTLLDSAGRDITPSDRQDIATFDVVFEVSGTRVLVDSSDLWSHGSKCF